MSSRFQFMRDHLRAYTVNQLQLQIVSIRRDRHHLAFERDCGQPFAFASYSQLDALCCVEVAMRRAELARRGHANLAPPQSATFA